jgi:hypothetical protein
MVRRLGEYTYQSKIFRVCELIFGICQRLSFAQFGNQLDNFQSLRIQPLHKELEGTAGRIVEPICLCLTSSNELLNAALKTAEW